VISDQWAVGSGQLDFLGLHLAYAFIFI
jgi:hypothetical protein